VMFAKALLGVTPRANKAGSDQQFKRKLIRRQSIAPAIHVIVPATTNTDCAGRSCGRRAYGRPGGKQALCYERDVSQQYKTQPIAIGAWCLNSALRIVQSDSRRGGSTDERVAISSITRLLLASITDLTSFKLFGFKLG